MDSKIIIMVISKEHNIEKLEATINNLRNNNCTSEEIVVAIERENAEEIIEYCQSNDIKYVEYEKLDEVYYDIHKNLEFDYISFIEEGDKYNKNFKEKILKHIANTKHNIIVGQILNKKKKYLLNKVIAKGIAVDIERSPQRIWIHLESAFVSKKILDSLEKEADDTLEYYVDKTLLSKVIAIHGGYKIARNIKLTKSKKLEDSDESKEENYDLAWYKNLFIYGNNIFNYSIQKYGAPLKFLQYMFMYIAKNVINENVNMKNKHIIVDEKKEEFYSSFKQILQQIDDEIIMATEGNKRVNYYLLNLKYGKSNQNDIKYREFIDKINIINNNKRLFTAKDVKIKVLLMDYVEDNLIITASYPFQFDESKLKIFVTYLGEKIYAEKNYLYSDYRAFGAIIYQNYTFTVKIPLKENKEKQYIEFFVEGEKAVVRLDLNFNKPLTRLSKAKYSYWNCGKFTLNYRKKSILVLKNNKLRYIKREFKYIKSLLKNKKKYIKNAGKLRIIYHLTKPFYRKEIWLFQDKVYKAGDNGEYLYTYANKQKDGIKKYYIMKKDCLDAKRFKKEHKKFVEFGSLKHKLLFLNANIVFTTHNNVTKQHGFDEKREKYFRDLFNSTNVCIQHGLSVQYIPHLINRVNDNLKGFYLASPIEKENMSEPEFAYGDNLDILKITGSPRYDGLKNNDKKQILITPTWRSYLALPSVKYGESRRHNNNFIKSDYFRIYNTLINDPKLINVAKETGYKIIYLLHPCTSSQIDDFDKNEDVELIAATDDLNYEKILTESSLMVTDYSGVQFDFAYMYKPIVYFHPEELPPSYEEGAYKYETMSLGEIVKESDKLVDTLCEYMKNDCKIKPEYEKRIDKFFKYHDYNNCKRIYDDIMEFRNGEKQCKEFSKDKIEIL